VFTRPREEGRLAFQKKRKKQAKSYTREDMERGTERKIVCQEWRWQRGGHKMVEK
jgi:hypothetical protein